MFSLRTVLPIKWETQKALHNWLSYWLFQTPMHRAECRFFVSLRWSAYFLFHVIPYYLEHSFLIGLLTMSKMTVWEEILNHSLKFSYVILGKLLRPDTILIIGCRKCFWSGSWYNFLFHCQDHQYLLVDHYLVLDKHYYLFELRSTITFQNYLFYLSSSERVIMEWQQWQNDAP